MDKKNENISRRTALKHIGMTALGSAGTAYGLTALAAETNSDESAAISTPNTTPMKVLLINGSPRSNGNTFIALSETAKALNEKGVQTHIANIGPRAIQGCTACNHCITSGECVFKDPLYTEIREHLKDADGIIIGSPVYFSGPTGPLCSLLDRVFYSSGPMIHNKAASAIAVCRRSGGSATLDRLNKYFTHGRMQVIGSQYWNIAHGTLPGEVRQDGEGLQIMRTLGRNMAWAINNSRIAAQPVPEREDRIQTNFIR